MSGVERTGSSTKNFFISNDVRLARSVILPSSADKGYENADFTPVQVMIEREHFPLDKPVNGEMLYRLRVSAKSRRAHSGLVIYDRDANFIRSQVERRLATALFADNMDDLTELGVVGINPQYSPGLMFHDNMGYLGFDRVFEEPQIITMLMCNLSARPLRLEKDDGLFRFIMPRKKPVTGDKLLKIVHNINGKEIPEEEEKRGIYIRGKKGEDWSIAEDQNTKEAIGIYIKIKPESERWLSPSDEPLYIPETVRDYRSFLEPLWAPSPTDRDFLCIGRTPYMELRGYHVEIHPEVAPRIKGKDQWLSENGYQIPSPHIDDGSSWEFVTEVWRIMERYKQAKSPNFAFLEVYRA